MTYELMCFQMYLEGSINKGLKDSDTQSNISEMLEQEIADNVKKYESQKKEKDKATRAEANKVRRDRSDSDNGGRVL